MSAIEQTRREHMSNSLLGFLLVTLGMLSSAGCVSPDLSQETVVGEQSFNFRGQVGTSLSKPIRLNVTTEDQAMSLLGSPELITRDEASIGYFYETQRPYDTLWKSAAWTTVSGLRLDFDDNHILRHAFYAEESEESDPNSNIIAHLLEPRVIEKLNVGKAELRFKWQLH